MLSQSQAVLSVFVLISLLMVYLWKRQQATKNAGVVDVAWAYSFGAAAIFYSLFLFEGNTSRKILICSLVCIWSFRLGTYLYKRVAGKAEDTRYAGLRESWGDNFESYLLYFYIFQALTVALLSICYLKCIAWDEPLFRFLDILAILILLVSVIGEGISDKQLSDFKKEASNKGKVCKNGLWRYSRHPNYFFEWLHWWTYVAAGITAPGGWLTLIGPVFMLIFILKFSGIPATEERSLVNRGEAYRKYQQETNAFFPGPWKEVD